MTRRSVYRNVDGNVDYTVWDNAETSVWRNVNVIVRDYVWREAYVIAHTHAVDNVWNNTNVNLEP